MNFKLKIWRQADAKAKGGFETYEVNDISEDTSFLEMLDILNNNLIHEAKNRWRSTTTAVRVSVACVRCISTARRTVRIPK